MGRSGCECCVVFFFLSFLLATLNAEEHSGNDLSYAGARDIQWYIRRKPGLWLDPHVARRKRNIPYEESFKPSSALEREQLESLMMDAAQEPPWAVVAINEGKRHTVNFTPRLGRESGEEAEIENWLDEPELNRELMTQRSPPFAPRLGRRMNNYYFDPRLGKRSNQKML